MGDCMFQHTDHLDGMAVFNDDRNTAVITGRITFATERQAKSIVLIESLDGARREEFVITNSGWCHIANLIDGIRSVGGISPRRESVPIDCELCGGTLWVYNEDDGTYADCPQCQ